MRKSGEEDVEFSAIKVLSDPSIIKLNEEEQSKHLIA